jgi:hypothetical protein
MLDQTYLRVLRRRYKNKKRDAAKRGIDFDLTLEEFVNFSSIDICQYTGAKLSHTNNGHSSKRFSLDRIDNNRGYTKDNIAVCSAYVNELKSNLTEFNGKLKVRVKVSEDGYPMILNRDKNGNRLKRRFG